jgi:hypothetical protein
MTPTHSTPDNTAKPFANARLIAMLPIQSPLIKIYPTQPKGITMQNRLIVLIAVILTAPCILRAADSYTVTISAGDTDRISTPVSFTLPNDFPAGGAYLTSQKDQIIPLHISGHTATFILDNLPASKSATYKLQSGVKKGPIVNLTRDANVLKISAGDKPILTYQGDPSTPPQGVDPVFTRGGYIHPVYTPSGKLLTDDYTPDHKHHHGIWSPWTKTEFEGRHPDFWNMGTKTGRVDFVKLDDTFADSVAAGFRTHHRMIDMTANPEKPAINETWDVTVYAPVSAPAPLYIFDLIIHQECASQSPLILPKYHYGGLGFRGNRQWKDIKDNCSFLTSEGKTRANGNETKGRWCHISGQTDGQMTGVAILDHPSNFRSPQGMRLNPDIPFFCFAPSQDGQWEISPDKPYTARYRFIVMDSGPDKDLIERLYTDWADPPKVEVK